VPWNDLKGKPVDVQIEGITLILQMQNPGEFFGEESYHKYVKKKLLGTFRKTLKVLETKAKEKKNSKGASFFETIFDNLKLTISHVNFRIDCCPLEEKFDFSFGGFLSDLKLRTIDADGRSIFVKRKDKYQMIRKVVSFGEFKIYHDKNVLKNVEEYHQYLLKKNFKEIFTLKINFFLEIRPYNPKENNFRPIYSISTFIDEVLLDLDDECVKSAKLMTEVLSIHKMSFLQ